MRDLDELTYAFEETVSELKRAEHSIYVSLKYTRTKDVLESILERLINTLSNLIDFLIMLKTDEEFNPAKKIDLVLELYNEPFVKDVVKYYKLLRLVKKRDKIVQNQYRRHVKMIVEIAPKIFYIVDIDSVVENYKLIKSFVEIAHQYLLEIFHQKNLANSELD